MKRLVLSITVAAFAMAPAVFAGDCQSKTACAGKDKAACSATAKTAAKSSCCAEKAQAKTATSVKGATLLAQR